MIKFPKFIVIVVFNELALMKTVNSTCSAKYSRCVDFVNDFYEKTMKQIWNSPYYYFQIKAWVNRIRETWILSMDDYVIFLKHRHGCILVNKER